MNNYLNMFERDGYVVIKNAVPEKECQQLITSTLLPILHKKGIYLTKPTTWNYKYSRKKEGVLIAGRNSGHIISKYNKNFRFPALYNSHKLNDILNAIHSRNSKKTCWDYQYFGNEGLGWIHLRFPCYKHTKELNKCITDNSFHLDGTLTDSNNNTIINLEQSVIILPFITTVKKNGGGTAVIPGSHKLINDYVLRSNYKTNLDLEDTIDKIVKKNESNIIDIDGTQGDILILHPHLVHGSSLANVQARTRITFNLGTTKIINKL